jgi:hypothetical protein
MTSNTARLSCRIKEGDIVHNVHEYAELFRTARAHLSRTGNESDAELRNRWKAWADAMLGATARGIDAFSRMSGGEYGDALVQPYQSLATVFHECAAKE